MKKILNRISNQWFNHQVFILLGYVFIENIDALKQFFVLRYEREK